MNHQVATQTSETLSVPAAPSPYINCAAYLPAYHDGPLVPDAWNGVAQLLHQLSRRDMPFDFIAY